MVYHRRHQSNITALYQQRSMTTTQLKQQATKTAAMTNQTPRNLSRKIPDRIQSVHLVGGAISSSFVAHEYILPSSRLSHVNMRKSAGLSMISEGTLHKEAGGYENF